MAFAIVPARAGSKRIPYKNFRDFLGKPIIEWVLEALSETGLFEQILVSTDSVEIAEFVADRGYPVPFIRPSNLATDYSSTADVANHSIDWLLDNGASPMDSFCLAYPTAVMMTPEHILSSYSLLTKDVNDFIFVGAELPSHPARAWEIDEMGMAYPIRPRAQQERSQDLGPAYYDAGQLYWSYANGWRDDAQPRLRRKIYEIDLLEAIDINYEQDWARAERVFLTLRGQRKRSHQDTTSPERPSTRGWVY